MCGLAGFARQKGRGDVKASLVIAETLLCEIANRGRHATGFAAVNDKGEAEIWKKAVAVEQAVKQESWKEAMAKLGTEEITMFIGHVRYSTHFHNRDKDEAAHPFYENGVVGAHNGVITNWREVGKQLGIGADWDVDSQAAIGALAKMKKPERALKLLEGWFALTWIKKGKLFMVKSKGSPLACAYVPHVRTLFWCSEMRVLREVIDKAVPEKFTVDFYELADERLYEYNVINFGEQSNVKKTEMRLENAGQHKRNQQPLDSRRDNVADYWRTRGFDAHTGAQISLPLNEESRPPMRRSMSFGEMELLLRKHDDAARQMWTFIANKNAQLAVLTRQVEALKGVKEIADLALELVTTQMSVLAEYGFDDVRIEKLQTRAQRLLKEAERESTPLVREYHGQADGMVSVEQGGGTSTESTSTAVTVIPGVADQKCNGCGRAGSEGDPLFTNGEGGYTHESCIFAAAEGSGVYAD
jgi:hypothetical protein